MSYVNVEIKQARNRKLYYAEGIHELKLTPGEVHNIRWFDNEDYKGPSLEEIPLPEIGEYRAHVYFFEAKDTWNCVTLSTTGPGLKYLSTSEDWSEHTSKFVVEFSHLYSDPTSFSIGLVATNGEHEVFSCRSIAMILEQTV